MDLEEIICCTGIIQTAMPSSSICGGYSITMQTDRDSVCVRLTPQTYVVDCTPLRPGMRVAAFHTANVLPPEQHSAYPAFLIAPVKDWEHVTLKYFDHTLTAQDDSLKLNISPQTNIQTANGQRYTCHPGSRTLLVYYDVTPRILPPQTSPGRIIVL